MRRAAALAAAVAAALAVTSCSDGSARKDVNAYVTHVNSVERRSAPAFRAAERTYVEFSRGRLAPGVAAARLGASERAIRASRGQVAAIRAPADAAALRARLLRVYDLNARMAHETTQLGRYRAGLAKVAQPLRAASRGLQRGLSGASGAAGQRAPFAAYSRSLRAVIDHIAALDTPPLLRASHAALLKRLRAARSLAGRLAQAIGAQDAKRVAGLLLRFRRLGSSRSAASLPPRVVRAYDGRLRAITAAEADLRREEQRLNRRFR